MQAILPVNNDPYLACYKGEKVTVTDGTTFVNQNFLGKGSSKLAYRAQSLDSRQVAILYPISQVQAEQVLQEGSNWRECARIAKGMVPILYEVQDFPRVLLVVEYLPHKFCAWSRTKSLQERIMALAKIAEILCLFHDAKKVHGDLKPSNLALRSESPDSCAPLDFGSVSSTGLYDATKSSTLGTSSYSPVNLTQTVYERERYDIFAAAAIFYDILYTWPNPVKEGCLCKDVAEFSQRPPNQFLAGWNPRILTDFITTRSNLPASLKPIFLNALVGEGTTYTMLHLLTDLQALHHSIESRKISLGTPRDSESSYELSDQIDDDEIEEQIYESNSPAVIPIFKTSYEYIDEIPEEIEGES